VKRFHLERPNRKSVAIAIAIHVVVAAVLVQIAFKYQLGQLMGLTEPNSQEHLQYVAVSHNESSGGRRSLEPAKDQRPAALQAPRVTPTAITIASPRVPIASRAAGAVGSGFGITGDGNATGVEPRMPDSRIALLAGPVARVPRTVAEDVDSIVSLAIGIVNDSAAIAQKIRKPGDWTFKGKDGKVYGWDPSGIRLGKYTIPNALLALLPLNVSSPGSPIEARTAAYIRRDVQENGQRAISEDEFRTAVKRIRERKEREKRQQQLASDQKAPEKGQP
jgi:hypothetical protein